MSGPASNGDPGAQQVPMAPCAQQQQRSAPASDIAKTKLASLASSSRDSTCHGSEQRRRSGLPRSTSSRDLDDGVREWEQPHVWLEKGPPMSPCEPERLSTLHSIAPHGQLENLHHPKFGEPLRPCNSLCKPTERWTNLCACAHYLSSLVAPAAYWNQQCHHPFKQCSNRQVPAKCFIEMHRLRRAIAGSGVQNLWHRKRSSVANGRERDVCPGGPRLCTCWHAHPARAGRERLLLLVRHPLLRERAHCGGCPPGRQVHPPQFTRQMLQHVAVSSMLCTCYTVSAQHSMSTGCNMPAEAVLCARVLP